MEPMGERDASLGMRNTISSSDMGAGRRQTRMEGGKEEEEDDGDDDEGGGGSDTTTSRPIGRTAKEGGGRGFAPAH